MKQFVFQIGMSLPHTIFTITRMWKSIVNKLGDKVTKTRQSKFAGIIKPSHYSESCYFSFLFLYDQISI